MLHEQSRSLQFKTGVVVCQRIADGGAELADFLPVRA